MKLSINKIITLLILFIISIFSIVLFFKEKKEFSPNENRYLKTKVEFSIERLLNKKFISDFENLLTDQFPLRDNFIKEYTYKGYRLNSYYKSYHDCFGFCCGLEMEKIDG